MAQLQTGYKQFSGISYDEIDEKIIIVNVKNARAHELNTVATFVWKLLTEFKTLNELTKAVVNEYEIDFELAQKDILALIDGLISHDLITIKS